MKKGKEDTGPDLYINTHQKSNKRRHCSLNHVFLVACTQLYNPLCPSVHPSVGWLVGRLVTLYFFYDFYFRTSLLLPKWSNDLKYGPCPPARDFGSRVSGLVVSLSQSLCLSIKKLLKSKKVRIHGNQSCVRVGRGHI